jgi:hypothetical protein
MWIGSVRLLAGSVIRLRRHQPDRRIVHPLLPLVIVLLDRLLFRVTGLLGLCRRNSPVYKLSEWRTEVALILRDQIASEQVKNPYEVNFARG